MTKQTSLTEIKAERCRKSFYYFFKEFWGEIEHATLVDNWHIKFVCDKLQEVTERMMRGEKVERDLIINIPPGTTKSTMCTVMLPAWCWTKMPEARVISGSYSGGLSTGHAGKSKDVIESDKYREWFPRVSIRQDYSGKGHYMNEHGGERYTTSTKGTVTGKHAHLIIVDDPMNPKIAASDKERFAANEFITQTLPSRKVDKEIVPTIIIMQRLHVDDPTGNLLDLEPEQWEHVCLPAELADNVKPESARENYIDGLLDPVRMDRDVLDKFLTRLGSYAYAGQFEQRPVPKEGGIWKENYFNIIKREDIPARMNRVATDWDLAYTSKEKNSASAFVTSGYFNNRMYIINCGAVWKEFPELISFMKTIGGTHYVEDKASGKSAVQTLRKQGVTASLVSVNGDKLARTRDVTPHAEAGRVYVVDDVFDYLFHDRRQGISNLTEENDDIDLNDALTQAMARLMGTGGTNWDMFEDDDDIVNPKSSI